MSTLNGGPGNIVTNGLILYLDAANSLSYVSGSSTWRDISSSNLSGSLFNGPTFSSGNGGSIVFDGTNDYIQLGDATNLITNTSQITCETWLKTNVINTYKKIFVTGDNSAPNASLIQGIYFSIGPSPYNVYFGLKTSTNQDAVISTTNLSTTNYSHIVGTYNNPEAKIYINGILMASFNIGGTIGTGGQGRISGYANGNEVWDGNISIFKIYNQTLSASEVLQNYNSTKARFGL